MRVGSISPHIDRDSCSGTGTCARLLPGVFRLVQDGQEFFAEVIPGGEATEDELWGAAKACPWAAIILEREDGQVVYP